MDTNHQYTSAFTNANNTWSMQKIRTEVQDHYQIPMASGIWPNYHLLQMHQQAPSSSSTSSSSIMAPSSSSSGFLGDILGVHIEEADEEEPEEELGAMKEMMYKIAAMQPVVDIDPATIRKPKRRNVRISDDPQSVAARHRRERISEKIRILQRLVPGGTKMDTASMLDEAIRYVKFLKRQIRLLQSTPQTQHQQHPLPQPPHCIGVGTLANPTTSTLLLTPGIGDWPFAPNMFHSSTAATTTASSTMDMPAGLGFNAGGHGHVCDGSSSFNHHEVIRE